MKTERTAQHITTISSLAVRDVNIADSRVQSDMICN